jgi:hypothetical protein
MDSALDVAAASVATTLADLNRHVISHKKKKKKTSLSVCFL